MKRMTGDLLAVLWLLAAAAVLAVELFEDGSVQLFGVPGWGFCLLPGWGC